MHTTATDFSASILESPDDDAPRLIYADWLEERGDPLAEFIRAQCERERTPWHHDRWWQLLDREQMLEAQHGQRWLAGWKKPPRLSWGINASEFSASRLDAGLGTFRRGLPEMATAIRQQRIDAARALMGSLVRDVFFRQFDPRLTPRFVASDWMTRLRGMCLPHSYLGLDFLGPLSRSWKAAGLRRLELEGNFIQRSALEALCASPYLQQLESLNLANNRLASRDLDLFLDWPGMPRLRALWLYSGNFGGDITRFVSSPALASLHLLDLGLSRMSPNSVHALVNNPHLRRLTHLSLKGISLSQEIVEGLFTCGLARSLRVLHVGTCGLRDADVELLANTPDVTGLRRLALDNLHGQTVKITSRGVRALAASPHLRELRCLSLGHVDIDVETADKLLTSTSLPRLQEIRLSDDPQNRAAWERLSQRFRVGVD